MKNGKKHLRAPGPTRTATGREIRYPRILCTSKRARTSAQAVPYKSFGDVRVMDRCKLCNAIYKRLRRNGGP